jgi:Uma2 family endonuclease
MATEVLKKHFTVRDYHRMAEAGIIRPEERVELIEGEIIQMSPIGHRHHVRVTRTNTLFVRAFGDRAVVSCQSSIELNEWTEPQPDLVVYKPRSDFYAAKKPTLDDVLLVMEISDTSLRYDRNIKIPLFSSTGIPEVWIQDVAEDIVYVYRDPRGRSYAETFEVRRGNVISPLAFPDIQFALEDLLGPPVPEL